MERHPMFTDWKAQCCSDVCTTPNNLLLMAIPIRNPMTIFEKMDRPAIKFISNSKAPNRQNNLKKRKRVKELIFLNFETYYKASY